MSKLKIEHVNKAYAALRISGLTSDPTPEENTIALDMLEDMMHEFESRNICTNYVFEGSIDGNTDSGIDSAFNNATAMCLAIRIANFFGKDPTSGIMMQANAGLSNWSARTSKVNQIKPSRRQSRGSGNTFRFSNWTRYYRTSNDAPISCDTFKLKVGETDFFSVDFSGYLLDGATVVSYTITSDSGIQVITDVLDVSLITLECKGLLAGYNTVDITVTTSTGRVNPIKVNFNVTES